jgi:hypothetical protein
LHLQAPRKHDAVLSSLLLSEARLLPLRLAGDRSSRELRHLRINLQQHLFLEQFAREQQLE